MQSVGRGLRCVAGGAKLQLQARQSASPLHPQWIARRSASFNMPWDWIQQRFVPGRDKKRKQEDENAIMQKRIENPSLFESSTAEVVTEASEASKAKKATGKQKKKIGPKHTEHKYSTANFKISHRKLNMLGRQISGQPIDHAIMQMYFSEKRASKRVVRMLKMAKSHAQTYKDLPGSKLVVSQAWVTKGPKQLKRLEQKGRGKFGIRIHPDSRMHVILKVGKTHARKVMEERERKLKVIKSAGLVREDVPLRNPGSMWAW